MLAVSGWGSVADSEVGGTKGILEPRVHREAICVGLIAPTSCGTIGHVVPLEEVFIVMLDSQDDGVGDNDERREVRVPFVGQKLVHPSSHAPQSLWLFRVQPIQEAIDRVLRPRH